MRDNISDRKLFSSKNVTGHTTFNMEFIKSSLYSRLSINSLALAVKTNQKMNNIKMYGILFVIITIFNLFTSINAGPVYTRHRRMMRDAYSELNLESSLNNTTQYDSDDKCILDGVQVSQSTVNCEKKNGCRAIQKTGYCCPDYQCECERNGKTYENGAKLVDPETPCKVCYCQGGEILCNSVTCYNRDDCVPKYITGRCCPEYDNCPPLDELPPLSTSSKPMLVTFKNKFTLSPSSAPQKVLPEISNNPLGIKIKEITKPEEIRIIDERPKIYPISKSNGITNVNQSKIFSLSDDGKSYNPSTTTTTSSTTTTTEYNFPDENSNTPDDYKLLDVNLTSENINGLENSDLINSENIDEENSFKAIRQTGEINENAEYASSTPKGEEVVIVDRNGQSKPILILGIEGLQRGDIVEEVTKEHGLDVLSDNSKRENPFNEVTNDDDFEPEVAGSEVNIHVSKVKPEIPVSNKITTEGPIDYVKGSSTPREIFETILYTSGPESSEEKKVTNTAFETVYHEPKHSSESVSVSAKPKRQHYSHPDDDDTTTESNPAYPTFPYEDLSIHGSEMLKQARTDDYQENSNGGDKTKLAVAFAGESKIVSAYRQTTEGPDDISSEVIQQISQNSSNDPLSLIEWEKNSTETHNNDTSDNLLTTDEDWQNQSSMMLDIDPGSGSGLGQIYEPTLIATASKRPKSILDYDDAAEASADNPVILNHNDDHQHSVQSENENENTNNEQISHIFDPDRQLADIKIQRAFETLQNFFQFRKKFESVF